jgi:hypothetical protein
MSRGGRRSAGPTAAVWWIATGLACWSCAYAVRRADDLWWHLAAGRWMLDHGRIARTDPFSFTAPGAPWLNDAWLADVLLAAWAAASAPATLVWWKWGMVVATFLVLFATARRLAHTPDAPAGAAPGAFVAVVLGAVTAGPFLDLRPQLYTFLGVALVLHACVGRPTPARWLPLVFLAWANLHAGFIFGLGALVVLLAPSVRGGPARGRALAVAALSVGACLINPHGASALARPLRYALDTSSPYRALAEWWPPFRPGGVASALYPYLIGIFAGAAIAALALPRLRRRTGVSAAVVLGVVTLAMSLTSRRFVPVFALVQAATVAPVLATAFTPLARRLPPLLPALAALILGGVWLAPYPRASDAAFHYLTTEDHFPVETCTFIETNALTGNVFAQYAWAGYVTMRTRGRLKVYIDGRADAVYPDRVFTSYDQAAHGEAGWMTVIEDSAAEWVLWPRHLPWGALPQALLQTGRWRQVHVDAVAVLLRRDDGAAVPRYAPTPDSPFRDYALGVLAFERGAFDDAATHLTRALTTAPHLRRACNALAAVRLRQGDPAAGWATIARCQTVFPDPDRTAWFATQVER